MTETARRLPDLERAGDRIYRLDIVPPTGVDEATRDSLVSAVSTGFINRRNQSGESFRPSIVYNNTQTGTSVLDTLIEKFEQLGPGDSFDMAIAFINQGGLDQLLLTFDLMARRGVHGRLITGTYLSFTDPQALRTLLLYPDIDVRVYNDTEYKQGGLHAKGYAFRHGGTVDLIVGSSNITERALQANMEWNLAVSSAADGDVVDSFYSVYEQVWNAPCCVPLTPDFIADYEVAYRANQAKKVMATADGPAAHGVIEPNDMQRPALANLADERAQGEPRALVISATGTGKTYLTAFDVKQCAPKPRRVLFIVHRERIAKAALKSFRRVLGDAYSSYGLYGGGNTDVDANCLFCTIQTLSRSDNYRQFSPREFDYIIVDEVHRVGGSTYQRVLDYFEPRFLLGMSATPERNDGFDVFEFFNYQVAYEIRLQQALENHLVAPFHYFGITDEAFAPKLEGGEPDYAAEAKAIIDQSRKFGYSGPRLKCLIFCSRNVESERVAEEMSRLGARVVSLAGASTDDERENAMERLEAPDGPHALDYIITVDIFNEGVDIPTVNQVVMVRPTESAIVFVQQLGRGLRINPEKDYVCVVDFIGNYQNNYNIPIALNGDRSFEKERLRHDVHSGGAFIPGTTSIQFDEVSRKKVLRSINKANFTKMSLLRDAYKNLRRRLGRIPTLEDFRDWGEASPYNIFDSKSLGSYHEFLTRCEPDYHVHFNEDQRAILRFVSCELANGKRPTDLVLLRSLMESGGAPVRLSDIASEVRAAEEMRGAYRPGRDYTRELHNACRVLSLEFYPTATRSKYPALLTRNDDAAKPTQQLLDALADTEFKRQLEEVIDFGLHTFELEYADASPQSRLCINSRYTRKDACRLLCWDKNEEGTINGYAFKTSDWVIFVTYEKAADVAASIRYRDELVSQEDFIWYSQSNRSLQSEDYRKLSRFDPATTRIHLFIKKSDSEGSDHYYLGCVRPHIGQITEEKQRNDAGKELPILRVPFTLEHPVARETFRYLTS